MCIWAALVCGSHGSILHSSLDAAAKNAGLRVGLVTPIGYSYEKSVTEDLVKFIADYKAGQADGEWRVAGFVIRTVGQNAQDLVFFHETVIGFNVLDQEITIKDFSGSPSYLTSTLRTAAKVNIHIDGVVSSSSYLISFDFITKLQIEQFDGTLGELLFSCLPQRYRSLLWQVEVNKAEPFELTIQWAGPVEGTPLINATSEQE